MKIIKSLLISLATVSALQAMDPSLMPPMVPSLGTANNATKPKVNTKTQMSSCDIIPPMIINLPPPLEDAVTKCKNERGMPKKAFVEQQLSKLLKKNLDRLLFERITGNPLIHIIPPVSYLEMLQLEKNCEMIFTDSGGVQKEAYFFKKPVVILRSETEWIEILEQGCGIVANAFQENILEAADYFKRNADRLEFPPLYGDGHAADFIAEKLFQNS